MVVVEQENKMDKFEMPDYDKYSEFTEEMGKKMEDAERLGLKDFSKVTALSGFTMQGIGMFYPAHVNENDETEPNTRNDRYHVASADLIETMQWVTKHLWQNRMKDFATGTVLFAANMLVEIGDGQHKELVAKSLDNFKKEFPDEAEPNDFVQASYILLSILEMLLDDKNKAPFQKMYEQVLNHEEPELITIGDIRTVSSIIQGGYTSDTITKEEALDGMSNTVTDKDIEKFLQQITKNNKKQEEE